MSDYNTNNNYNYSNEEYDIGVDNLSNFNYERSYNGGNTRAFGFSEVKRVAMSGVVTKAFAFMFVALLITAFSSMITSPATAIRMLSGGSFIVLFIVEIAIVFAGNAAISKNNAVLAGVLYTAYSFINGMTLSIIYMAYTGESIVSVFFITASMFAVMAIIGFVTKKDLSGIGSMLLMGLLGVIIASFVNIFILRNPLFDLVMAVVGVIIFCGLTAYDVQRTRRMAEYAAPEAENTLALFCAFQLYLDFINIFLKLLRIMGRRK